MMNEQLSQEILAKITTIEQELTTIRTEQTNIICQLTTMAETQNDIQQHITTLRINQMRAIQELVVIKQQLSPGSSLSSTQRDHEQTTSENNEPAPPHSSPALTTIDQRLQLQEYSIHLLNQRQLALESELLFLKNK